MSNSKAIYIPALILSVVLFIMGQIFFVSVFSFFEPAVEGITFQITELNTIVKTSVLFSLLLALIPVLIVLVWRSGKIILLNRRIAAVLIVLLFISAAILVRHYFVKMYFTRIVNPALLPGGEKIMTYPLDPVNFVYYMYVALVLGAIVSYFMFRSKSKKNDSTT